MHFHIDGLFQESMFFILVSFAISMAWAPVLIHVLYKFKIVRLSKNEYAHIVYTKGTKAGTPIMGGLLIVLTTAILTLLFNWNGNTYVPIIVLLGTALLGGLDDVLNIYGRKRILRPVGKQWRLVRVHRSKLKRVRLFLELPWNMYLNFWYRLGSNPGKGIQAGEKILVQIGAGVMVAWWIYYRLGWDTIWLPFHEPLKLGILMPVLIVFTVVSMANAVNIADGADGLASGLAIPVFGALLVFAIHKGNPDLSLLISVTIGTLLAYLYFNIKPARFEMGDVGSLALGAMMASIAFALDRVVLLPVVGVMFVIIISSSLLQSVYRILRGRRLFKIAPLHLDLQFRGWSEEKVVMRFWLIGALAAVLGLFLGW